MVKWNAKDGAGREDDDVVVVVVVLVVLVVVAVAVVVGGVYSRANVLRGKPNSLSCGPVAGLLCVVGQD